MSCIYKYKGKDYTKDEFYSLVSSSNFIQQEQVKKFAELQERLNNKEFLEGAKGAYESTPALQQYGTQEQYNDYIARVSLGIIKNPSSGEYNYESQVKDIVYHFSNTNTESTITDTTKGVKMANLTAVTPDEKASTAKQVLINEIVSKPDLIKIIAKLIVSKVMKGQKYFGFSMDKDLEDSITVTNKLQTLTQEEVEIIHKDICK